MSNPPPVPTMNYAGASGVSSTADQRFGHMQYIIRKKVFKLLGAIGGASQKLGHGRATLLGVRIAQPLAQPVGPSPRTDVA